MDEVAELTRLKNFLNQRMSGDNKRFTLGLQAAISGADFYGYTPQPLGEGFPGDFVSISGPSRFVRYAPHEKKDDVYHTVGIIDSLGKILATTGFFANIADSWELREHPELDFDRPGDIYLWIPARFAENGILEARFYCSKDKPLQIESR